MVEEGVTRDTLGQPLHERLAVRDLLLGRRLGRCGAWPAVGEERLLRAPDDGSRKRRADVLVERVRDEPVRHPSAPVSLCTKEMAADLERNGCAALELPLRKESRTAEPKRSRSVSSSVMKSSAPRV
jgi:hypothetical protein